MKTKKKKLMKRQILVKRPKKVLIKKKTLPKKIKKSTKSIILRKNQLKKKLSSIKFAKAVKRTFKPKKKNNSVGIASGDSFTGGSFFKAKIKVIGIGGGGGSIVSEIGRSLHKATFMIADTDVRAFKKRKGIKYFLFGQQFTHGLGTGVNPELARQAAEGEKDRITKFFDDQDIIIFVASLGGGLGSGATKVFAQAAQNFNGITVGIFTLPFKFEGKNKYGIALRALRELKSHLNVSITIPNEKIFKVIDTNTAITDAFSMVNKSLIESLESLIDLIYSPGIINIDFADLRAILSGRGNSAFLNTAEASGKDRAEQVAKKILFNPLYQTNNFTAEKILFNIEGGGNLGMFEVDKISRAISLQNPKAKIIFGISKNNDLKNKIKTTLLMTGGGVNVKPMPIPAPMSNPVPAAAQKLVSVTENTQPNIEQKQVVKPVKKPKKKAKKPAKPKAVMVGSKEKVPFSDVFSNPLADFANQDMSSAKKIDIMELSHKPKKAIRRSALEIKKAEEEEENKKTLQEEEWEIPAFLRKVKFKP